MTLDQLRLFVAVAERQHVTRAGQLFLGEARAVLARAGAAELALAELGGLERGTLIVQASQTIASYWLPRHLVAFRRAYPKVAVRLGIGNTALPSVTVARDRMVLVVGPQHPWADGRTVAPSDLPAGEWVLRYQGRAAAALLTLIAGKRPGKRP